MRSRTKEATKLPAWASSLRIRRGDETPIFVQMREGIRRAILEGRLKPGDALMPQRQLCRSFKVNQVTATQAIGDLLREGLLRSEHGRGIFVNDLNPRCVAMVCASSLAALQQDGMYGEMLRAAADRLGRANVKIVYKTRELREKRIRFGPPLEEVLAEEADAYLTVGIQNEEYLGALVQTGKPVVAMDATPTTAPFDGVTFDTFREGYLCARKLLEAGHRRIVFLGQDRGAHPGDASGKTRIPEPDDVRRQAGARYALEQAGVPAAPEFFSDSSLKVGGREYEDLAARIKAGKVTAVAAYPRQAEWLSEHIDIPGDASAVVYGVHQTQEGKWTGCRAQIAEMGHAAAQRVLRRLERASGRGEGGEKEFLGTVITLAPVQVDGSSVRRIGPPPEIYAYLQSFAVEPANEAT